jgi:hypothetical protein
MYREFARISLTCARTADSPDPGWVPGRQSRRGNARQFRLRRRTALALATCAAALVLAGGTAYASIPGTGGLITACYSRPAGALRVINAGAGAQCGRDEKKLSWNQAGPRGATGPRGLPGFDGANGKTLLSGTGTPAAQLGVNGDFYLDTRRRLARHWRQPDRPDRPDRSDRSARAPGPGRAEGRHRRHRTARARGPGRAAR